MKFGDLDHYYTGISIPVSALRSDLSCGVGEFADLEILANFCNHVGFEIIQILPVNDTGFISSPYSALSSFALHPIYIRLQAIPEASDFEEEIKAAKFKYENLPRLAYKDVLEFKLSILHKIFERNKKAILADTELKKWVEKNTWVKAYSVFYQIKRQYNFYHWKTWPKMQNPKDEDIERYWSDNYEDCLFSAWIQHILEQQLHRAAVAMEKLGIYLKGDIPILMNEDSVDVWINRKYFNLAMKAGAPPDMYSSTGQNWDFPIYNWDELKKDNYSFWRMRLRQAEKFYHAYRIDHVLGFFRIYTIPAINDTGRLGYFFPSKFISKEELNKAHFDDGRIRWLAVPHIRGNEVDYLFGNKADHIKRTYLSQIGSESLYNLKPEFEGEKIISNLDEDNQTKGILTRWYRDRALVEVSPGKYHRVWTYGDSSAFRSLSEGEKERFELLIKETEKESEHIWEKHGTELLEMMQHETEMLMCAEDLGVIPPCVPKVLKKLDILSLKIERWTKKYDEPDTPYIPVTQYPRYSVCTPSVHDTSTLFGWWELELSTDEKEKYLEAIGYKVSGSPDYTPELAKAVIEHILRTNSIFCIFQMQELFSLTSELRAGNPEDERINVPGTVSDRNWTYRIYSSLEFLQNYEKFIRFIQSILKERKERPLDKKY